MHQDRRPTGVPRHGEKLTIELVDAVGGGIAAM
jgi:hypothetical protein